MLEKIKELSHQIDNESAAISTLSDLEAFRIKFLSRNSVVSDLFDKLKNLPKDQKPVAGKELNLLKNKAETIYKALKEKIELSGSYQKSIPDLTLPGRVQRTGTKHIINTTLEEMKNIFKQMGFSVYEGPELESDYNNFTALNFADNHPARDMQDTFFISEKFLLRTHTSPVQIRTMERLKPPIRAIMPGRVFRNEAISARSYCMFHQVEGLFVDKNVTFADLKGTLVSFAKQFYGSGLKYQFRASFFPFTEPSAEMDITCFICQGKGCRVCKHTGWLEILGCGMVDPNVLKNVGYNPEEVSGYAFGIGIERTALLKYNIPDIRFYFENDIRFLKQF